jgi:nucleotide-binding universal stress UspA family protein
MKNHGFERILLATDESEQAEAAAAVAASFALGSRASVRVVHVWNLEVHHRHGVWDVETRSEAIQLITAAVNRLRELGVEAEGEVGRADHNHVGAAIAESARQFNADLVVIGSRGLSDWQAMWQHSVSQAVLGSVDCPVLIVRGVKSAAVRRPQRVLLAVAGGDDIDRGVRAAIAAASAPGSRVLVLHVPQAIFGAQGFAYVERDEDVTYTIETAMAMLRAAGVPAESRVAESAQVARLVADSAAEWDANVIVVGSSRVGDLTSLLFGSVTHELLRGTDIPVLVAERARG